MRTVPHLFASSSYPSKHGLVITSSLQTTIAGISGAASIFGSKEIEGNFPNGVKVYCAKQWVRRRTGEANGPPSSNENEVEFVARSKAKMTDLIRKKFSK